MTREEAIKYLNEFIFFKKISNTTEEEAVECFKLAIKALEAQPNEDCISRKAAIDALWKALYEYEDKTENQFLKSKELDVADWFQHRIFVQNMSDIDRQTILNLPSVAPQPKTGHWIEHKHGGIEHIECSKCRCWFLRKDLIRNSYCPNCGSRNHWEWELKMQEAKK